MSFCRLIDRKLPDFSLATGSAVLLGIIREQKAYLYDHFEVISARSIAAELAKRITDRVAFNDWLIRCIENWGSLGLSILFYYRMTEPNSQYLGFEQRNLIDQPRLAAALYQRIMAEMGHPAAALDRPGLEASLVLFTIPKLREDPAPLLTGDDVPANSEKLRRLIEAISGPNIHNDAETLRAVRKVIEPNTLRDLIQQSDVLATKEPFIYARARFLELLKAENPQAAAAQPDDPGEVE